VEERGGLGVEPQDPRVLLLGGLRSYGEATGRKQGPRGDEGPRPCPHETDARTERRADRGGATELPARLEGLLPARGYSGGLPRARRMAPPSPSSDPPQAVETRAHHLPRAKGLGSLGARGRAGGCQRPALVEN